MSSSVALWPQMDDPETGGAEGCAIRLGPSSLGDGWHRNGGRPPDFFFSFSDECMGETILSVWLMIALLCLYGLCGLLAEWFRRQTNQGPPVY